jgi:histidinol-phosphatase (PHP family)
MIFASYHNHTRFSDGAAKVQDMIEAAVGLGLAEVGISDHFTLHPDGRKCSWSMPEERLGEYVAAVLDAAREAPPLVRLGLEADFFPETVDRLQLYLEQHAFDCVFGSVHFAGDFQVDEGRRRWERLSVEERGAVWRTYWHGVAAMAQSRVFDVASHLDYPRRFGSRMPVELPPEAIEALDALAAADMAVEINTAGWYHPTREAYPSPPLLRAARERGIPILLSADAHKPEHLIRGFDKGVELARATGYTELVRYDKRRRFSVPL